VGLPWDADLLREGTAVARRYSERDSTPPRASFDAVSPKAAAAGRAKSAKKRITPACATAIETLVSGIEADLGSGGLDDAGWRQRGWRPRFPAGLLLA
jgi:hypothetical protein